MNINNQTYIQNLVLFWKLFVSVQIQIILFQNLHSSSEVSEYLEALFYWISVHENNINIIVQNVSHYSYIPFQFCILLEENKSKKGL